MSLDAHTRQGLPTGHLVEKGLKACPARSCRRPERLGAKPLQPGEDVNGVGDDPSERVTIWGVIVVARRAQEIGDVRLHHGNRPRRAVWPLKTVIWPLFRADHGIAPAGAFSPTLSNSPIISRPF